MRWRNVLRRPGDWVPVGFAHVIGGREVFREETAFVLAGILPLVTPGLPSGGILPLLTAASYDIANANTPRCGTEGPASN